MTDKMLYLIIGIMAGIIAILTLGKASSGNEIFAAPGKPSETVVSGSFMAIGSTTRTDNNLLWLIDTDKKKMLVYEYAQDNLIRLKAARDIQYDVNIPDGVAMPYSSKAEEGPLPLFIKKQYDDIRKKQEKDSPK
jgi:hypothetical protein